MFRFECPRSWDELQPTPAPGQRWCTGCARSVIACGSVTEARQLARRGACIAIPGALLAPSSSPYRSMKVGMICTDDPSDGELPRVAWLVPLDGPRARQTLRIPPTGGTLGSTAPADLVIPDPEIATPHARFLDVYVGFRLVDEGTPGGTYVNERRVTACELVDNDLIQVGRTHLRFKSIL